MGAATQIEEIGPVELENSRRFIIKSRIADAEFAIDIALPPPYLPGDGKWPVLIVTDGNMAFPTTASTIATLPLEPGGPQPVCVVGIGYPPPKQGEEGNFWSLRNRDLSPVRAQDWEERMRAAPPFFRMAEGMETGGGEKFLDFISEELLPFLAENFPVDVSDCTLAGSSLGGALVLHAMFTRPGMFARHLAISPSLWWADHYLLGLEEEFAKDHDDLASQLYLCIGGAEELQAPEARMVSNFLEFSKRLQSRGYSSLILTEEVHHGETHVSVFNAGITKGLRHLFGAEFHASG